MGKLNVAAAHQNKVAQVSPNGTNFTIAVSNVTPVALTVDVTPANATATYYFDIVEASSWPAEVSTDDIAASMKQSFDSYIAYYQQVGYDLTYADFLLRT